MVIGVISDTHGLIRPQALDALRGSDMIIHAGDVGAPVVLAELESIAPVVAVRGNCDMAPWAEDLPEKAVVEAGAIRILAVHDLHSLKIPVVQPAVRLVVSGHSHVPLVRVEGDVTYLNPGSAGPKRFRLPVTVARVTVERTEVRANILTLE